MPIESPRSGGKILVDQLVVQGVTQLYCIPGESYLAVLDALYGSKIEVVVCRQETGAAIAALTEGRLTGRPGSASLRAAQARPMRRTESILPSTTRPR